MGVVSGFPDLVFFGPRGQVCWIEFKSRNGRLSEAQAEVASHLVAAGHGYLCSSDYRDVIETLKGWGVFLVRKEFMSVRPCQNSGDKP